jgi:hypothetical protein
MTPSAACAERLLLVLVLVLVLLAHVLPDCC